jgi:hypothetical protein
MHCPLVRTWASASLLAVVAALNLPAQTTPPPTPPVNHDFDFWLGQWNVTTPEGKPAGTSRIESVADGHGLLENWTGDPASGGGNGKSLNCYNSANGKWQQFWIGSGGGLLELAGGLVDGQMVLSGSHHVRGQALLERITWTPKADGSVRQLWEQSPDGGKTWQAVFDGLYRKK